MLTVTVSQINRYIKAVLDEDKKLSDLYVKGEISNFVHHYKSGHFYFSLKDDTGIIRAVMFHSDAKLLSFEPENGMAVLARARVGVYERDGTYQLYVSDIQPEGAGAMAVAFEQCKAKLAALGMFDEKNKLPLPQMPKRIGVVTSETGAAFHDISSVLTRRYPLGTIVFSPAQVQGENAADTMIASLKRLEKVGRCDVIVIARGGGSTEDLWAFNSEALAYTIFNCNIPVISAIGHETDFTICDFVADMRAPTPSAAAELVAPDKRALRNTAGRLAERAVRIVDQKIYSCHQKLANTTQAMTIQTPQTVIQMQKEKLDFFTKTLYNIERIAIQKKRKTLQEKLALLNTLNPLEILSRGYAVVYSGQTPVSTVKNMQASETITIQLADGKITAVIQAIHQEELQ